MNNLVIKYNDVEHEIQVRESDGYLNATQLCKVGDKLFGDYIRNKSSEEYHDYISLEMGIPISNLIEKTHGGKYSGTWVHKEIAYHIASWVSPIFMHQLIKTYDRLLSGDLTLVRDVVRNHDKINNTESKVLIQTQELDLLERREQLEQLKTQNEKAKQDLEKQKILDKVEIEQALDKLDSSGFQTYASSIELIKELSTDGVLNDTDRRFYKDLIKNNNSRRSTLLALESKESYDARSQRFLVPVSDIYKDLTGKAGNPKIWMRLGKELAAAYRTKHDKEPSKTESHVNGVTRMINAYNMTDDPWIYELCKRVININNY